MYGMVPSRGPVCLPSAFANTACSRGSSSDSVEGDDVETSVSEAEAEWERILTAFDVFANALGPDFAPLPPDTTTPISTPFGLALQYRTHTIAVLWAYYYAGRILLHRLHPSMPPAMMVAAGVAASTTANYAQIIGKITAGVYYPQQCNFRAGSLSPTLSGALMEITVPVFFAAVQYTDPGQRGWTIAKLRDISRLTGWESSSAIARGCETAWVTAAKKGQGPPYEYTTKRDDNDTVSSSNLLCCCSRYSNSCIERHRMPASLPEDRRAGPIDGQHGPTVRHRQSICSDALGHGSAGFGGGSP